MSNYLKTDTEGVELFYRIDNATKPKANIIINHGFAEHLGRYDYLTERLLKVGYNVLRYDLRGHGQSKGVKGHIDSYTNFISDADLMVDLIKAKYPKLPTYMLGHSMGGLISTLYGLKYPEKLAGQILSAAANGKLPEASTVKAKGLALVAKFMPKKHMDNPVGSDICTVSEVVEAYLKDPLVLKSASFNFYNEFLNKASDEVLTHLNAYKLPVLILHGEKDVIVPVNISEHFYNSILSGNKEMVVYTNLFHEIFNEAEKDVIIDKVINWLNKQLIINSNNL